MAKAGDIEVNAHVHCFTFDRDASTSTRLVYVCRGCGAANARNIAPPERVRTYPQPAVWPPVYPPHPPHPWCSPVYIGDPPPGQGTIIWSGVTYAKG